VSVPRCVSTQVYKYLGGAVEGVGVQHRLDHDERLRQVVSVELVSVVRALVRTVVEHLEERRAAQVEHELKTKQVTKSARDHLQVTRSATGNLEVIYRSPRGHIQVTRSSTGPLQVPQ